MPFALAALDPAWNPLSQQSIEADTTFLLDPAADAAAGILPGYGAPYPQRSDGTPPTIVAGKYRQGIQVNDLSMVVPFQSLGASEFTIEFWLQNPTTDWSTAAGNVLFFGNLSLDRVLFQVSSAAVRLTLSHTQNPASPTSYSAAAQKTVTSGQFPAATWANVAATFGGGALTLYLNGVQVAQQTGVVAPSCWGGDGFNGFISIGAVGWIVSDLRVSRKARTPNVSTIIAPHSTTVTVGGTTANTIQKLAGFLHALPPNASGDKHNPPTPADALQASQGAMQAVRTDKLLTCTPIKAGATDGTHPTAGHSGAYSYDWQVVDRSIGYIINTLGCEPYISLDGSAQVLGGLVAPYSGTALTTDYAYDSVYGNGPVTNTVEYAKLCSDLIYHLTVEKGWTVPYVGLWNEPNGGFWASQGGTVAQYLTLYGAVMAAVKTVSSSTKVGGPETDWQSSKATWIQALINYCGTLAAPTVTSAAAQAGGGTFNGSTTRFYKIVGRNGTGNSVGSNEVSATPALNGSALISWPLITGADKVDIYAAATTGGQTGATSLLVAGLAGSATSFTDTGAALLTGAIPTVAAASAAPLDFISWHHYSGNLFEPAQLAANVAAWATSAGIATPALLCGETGWDNGNEGYWPYKQPHRAGTIPPGYSDNGTTDFFYGDWMAGFLAADLVNMQAGGVVRYFICDPAPTIASGQILIDQGAVPQTAYNVMRLWTMTAGNTVLSTTVSADPGVFAAASKNTGTGKVYVFLASIHYRKDKTFPTLVNVAGAGVADGANVTTYLVDDQHSNAFDLGSASAALTTGQTTTSAQDLGKVSGGQVGINLRPRAAALLVIG